MLIALFAISLTDAEAFQKDSLYINVNGSQRNMIVFTPNNVSNGLPLMIVTHGMNQNATYQYQGDRLWELIDSERFIIAYLNSNGGTWDIGGSGDLNFIDAAINYVDNRYSINRNRLYWSGFSMGSMLIYHGIRSEIGKKFAAFAPCSGVLFSAQPWNERSTPVNLIHCHAYGDDVFNYNQYGIRDYVTHFATLDNANNYTKVQNYYPNQAQFGWIDADKETWTGGTNGSEVELLSANSGGHWPTGAYKYEIWNFCKRFSLDGSSSQTTTVANFNYDSYSGRYRVDFNDLTTGGDLSFDSSTGVLSLPAGKSGTLTLTFNGADFSNVSKVKMFRSGDDLFNTLTITNAAGNSVNPGGAFYTSRYELNYAGYQANSSAVNTLVWHGNNDTSAAKTMTLQEILISVDVMRATKKHEKQLAQSEFGTWNGVGASAARTGDDAGMEYNIDQFIAGYGTIYGNGNVYANSYADLSKYGTLRVYGDNGIHIRALFNRPTDSSSDFILKEGDITDGVFEVDLASVGQYAHLNALKVGGGSGTAWSVTVTDDTTPMDYYISGKLYVADNLSAALNDLSATNYDATGLTNTSAVALNTANKNALIYVTDAAKLSNSANVVEKNGDSYSSDNIELIDGVSASQGQIAYAALGGGTTGNSTWSETGGNYSFEWTSGTSGAWVELMHYVNYKESLDGCQYKYFLVDTQEFTNTWGVQFLDGDANVLVQQEYWVAMNDGNKTKIIDVEKLFADAGKTADRSKLTKIRLFNIDSSNGGKVVVKQAYLYNDEADNVYPFYAPYDITAASAKLTTSVSDGFTLLTTPFAASMPSGFTSYALLEDNVLPFDRIDPNAPMLVKGNGELVLSASNVTVKATDGLVAGVLKGTYKPTVVPAGNYVQKEATRADSFSPVEGATLYAVTQGQEPTVYPFHAYATQEVVLNNDDPDTPDNPNNPEIPDNPDNPENQSYTLTVTSAGVSTMYLGFDALIPEDADFLLVAAVKKVQGTTAYLKRIKNGIIPANTGVMIFANPGTYTFNESQTAPTEVVESALHGVLKNTSVAALSQLEGGASIYVLSRGISEYTGFKLAGGTVKSVPANKAYLPVDQSVLTKFINFSFDDSQTTDIQTIDQEDVNSNADVFDLSGRKVNKPEKGIYIVNGKKILIK
ncbi:MAG: hypothetical protein IJ607_06220 [Bacteroidaceae bacterium]|nr:hypothetical protein [Bacteroidaceae bacterium]